MQEYFQGDEVKEVLLYAIGRILSGLVALASQPPRVSLVRCVQNHQVRLVPVVALQCPM